MALLDEHGRRINYLRLSITDRCNLGCRYCVPPKAMRNSGESDVLSFKDLHRIARMAVSLGLEKVRVTGGEPLVRPGVIGFLQDLAVIPGLTELVLTTNGVRLCEMAGALRRAGVQRLNVSLDSLRPSVFAQITRGGDLSAVLKGLAASEAAGFPPAKINVVVMRGINDSEVLDFAELTLAKAYTVRFIEYMPTMLTEDWPSLWVPATEVLERIVRHHPLQPLDRSDHAGPSRNFRIVGAQGVIGIIDPISHRFCEHCNRIRITATGQAKGCLFATEAVDLRQCLRQGDDVLRESLRAIVKNKPARHELFAPDTQHPTFSMAQIGG